MEHLTWSRHLYYLKYVLFYTYIDDFEILKTCKVHFVMNVNNLVLNGFKSFEAKLAAISI